MHESDKRAEELSTQQDIVLSTESLSSKTIALSAVDLSPLTDRMKEHNESAGPGVSLARIFGSVLHQVKDTPREEHDPDAMLKKALKEEDARRSSAQESFEADIAPTLHVSGLQIGPVAHPLFIVGAESAPNASQLAFHIGDAAQFSAYLSALDPTTMTPSQKRGLKSLAHSLCNQLRSDYDCTTPDDRLLSLVSAASAIEDNFERLNLPKKRLQTYIAAIRGRYLRDLIQAEKLHLDKPFGKGDGFILKWHRDCSPPKLQQNWHTVLDTLGALAANPSAANLYAQARETAQAALEGALAEVRRWSVSDPNSYEARKPTFIQILNQMKLRMTEF